MRDEEMPVPKKPLCSQSSIHWRYTIPSTFTADQTFTAPTSDTWNNEKKLTLLMTHDFQQKRLFHEYWSMGTRICGLLGSLAFVTSDTILSFNTFYMDIKNSGILIMVTYYLGQLLIAASCQFELTVEEDKDVDLDYDNATTFKSLLQA
eukprot:gene4543-3248_t